MKNPIKKITISTALAAMLLTTTTQAGTLTGGATVVHQILDMAQNSAQFIKQIAHYAKQVQQIKFQMESYKQMLANLGQLPQQQWDQFSSSVMDLKKALDFGEALNFQAASFDQDFQKKFPGFDKYLSDAKNGSLDFQKTYQDLRNSTKDTVQGTLKALGLQAKDMQSDEATMRQLENLSSSAVGQKAAIQAASEIALHQTHTLKKLQQTIMTQINMEAEYKAASTGEKNLKEAMKEAMKVKVDTSGAKTKTKLPF